MTAEEWITQNGTVDTLLRNEQHEWPGSHMLVAHMYRAPQRTVHENTPFISTFGRKEMHNLLTDSRKYYDDIVAIGRKLFLLMTSTGIANEFQFSQTPFGVNWLRHHITKLIGIRRDEHPAFTAYVDTWEMPDPGVFALLASRGVALRCRLSEERLHTPPCQLLDEIATNISDGEDNLERLMTTTWSAERHVREVIVPQWASMEHAGA